MNLVFITNPIKLEKVQIKREDLEKTDLIFANKFCSNKSLGGHKIHIVYDGDGETELKPDYKEGIIPYLENILNSNEDYYIVNHTHQSIDITSLISQKADSDKVYHDIHDLNARNSKHYKNLIKYLTDKETLNNWVDEITGKNKEINELNKKLTFLHKLLGDKLEKQQINEKLIEFNCSVSFNSDNKNASIIAIRNEILKP